MQELIDYSEYASTLIPKNASDELTLIARRIQYLCACYSDWNDEVEEIMFNLKDVNDKDKFLNQLNQIYTNETEH